MLSSLIIHIILLPLHPQKDGALAQLVEHRTENPCVPGSIPGGTTTKSTDRKTVGAFFRQTNNLKK